MEGREGGREGVAASRHVRAPVPRAALGPSALSVYLASNGAGALRGRRGLPSTNLKRQPQHHVGATQKSVFHVRNSLAKNSSCLGFWRDQVPPLSPFSLIKIRCAFCCLTTAVSPPSPGLPVLTALHSDDGSLLSALAALSPCPRCDCTGPSLGLFPPSSPG